MSLERKINIVKDILKDKKVAIGFSGGADSTLIAYLSSKVAAETLAITIDNHLLPTGFVENTKNVAKSFGIKHEIIDIDFYQKDYFLLNDSKRCYNCRTLMYSQIEKAAHERGYDFICDGNNISDLVIDRPGILVTYKKGFKTPFIDAKLTSKEIHEYLNKHDIPFSRSTTCLATRIPTDTPTTKEKISRISCCEDYILENTSCEIVKVRDLGKYAICEVDKLNELFNDHKYSLISDELKRQGFEKVALNLSEIDDDEYIKIEYNDGSFSYKLPFSINLENSEKILDGEIINKSPEKIETKNIIVNENGLIEGNDFKTYDDALYSFMEILPKLRRNV
ncbi:potassium ABC transporter ATPase [Methanobrevibacter sp. YE315]|uniref:7-cyano-7-deazaguanine synthase n=1 Tax=Methanobrevibacter sp. YE315 TaxID=1609968 RepID=UPI000764CFD7|nr:7-cyano-7-deazaguanine synthase [Methanobrevibacter sp. YE315]AMD17719.1 potassium ABC transporter ATPase [Methanobrevibacter sp. YE315]